MSNGYWLSAIGQKTTALDPSAWSTSVWLSAVDAPVVTEQADRAFRAADGASWFMSTVTNRQRVTSA